MSMVATPDKRHPQHISSNGKAAFPDVLRAAGVYGANGHGKTKLVHALRFVKAMVCGEEHALRDSFTPFRLQSNPDATPSKFVVEFRTETADYEYGLVIKDKKIEQEWLFEKTSRQDVMLFTRERPKRRIKKEDEEYVYEFGARLKNSRSPSSKFKMEEYLYFVSASISDQRTLLAEAADKKVRRLAAAANWFRNALQIVTADATYGKLHEEAASDKNFLDYLSKSLCAADTGISQLKIRRTRVAEDLIGKIQIPKSEDSMEAIRELDVGEGLSIGPQDGPSIVVQKEKDAYSVIEFVAVHASDNGDIDFGIDDESSGTRRLLDLYPMLYALNNEKSDLVFVVDELDRKLHPLLAFEFIKSFLDHEKGQLIFTTHTTHLLDQDLLRRDEVWFVQKKGNNSSDVYSLSDFKIRPDLDIRKGYLQGRFGGIPFVGNPRALGWC
jgi:AAA15 family ATPase/GTPase